MALPPKHRVDAPIVYICEGDSAWDLERAKREQYEAQERGEDPDAHPVRQYFLGLTRYDLSAGAGAYLLPDESPYKFHLRRLSLDEHAQVRDLFQNSGTSAACLRALRLALIKVEGLPQLDIADRREGASIAPSEFRRLGDLLGVDVAYEVGLAAWAASRDLSSAEKKP